MLKFDFSNLKGDFFGGIAAGVVALPVALAFGAAADMDPINGLYGAMILGFFAAFVSGLLACKWMIALVKKSKLTYFSIYCAIVGLIAIIYSLS